MDDDDDRYAAFVRDRAAALRRTAYLLCGDWDRAQDLCQTAFTKLYVAWPRLERHDELDGYIRRTLLRAWLDEQRRPWRREHVTGQLPDRTGPAAQDPVDATADRLTMRGALAAVPPRQRAVLVLRFFDDLGVEEAARLLDCSPGTVKSQTARGLVALRRALGVPEAEGAPR